MYASAIAGFFASKSVSISGLSCVSAGLMLNRIGGNSGLYCPVSFSVVTRLRATDMASGDGVCAGVGPIENSSMLPTTSRHLVGRKDIGWLLRRMITSVACLRLCASRSSRFVGRIGQVRTRFDEQSGDLFGPLQKPCEPNHDHDAADADQQLHPERARAARGVLNQDPVRAKRQEYAEAKQRQRVLTAQHHR